MASRQQLEDALIAAHEAGDTEAATLFASEIKSLGSAPAASVPDAFAGDALLSNSAMSDLSAGVPMQTSKPLGAFDRFVRYGKDYVQGLKQSGSALGQQTNDVPGVGTAEALGTMATGLVAPIPAALESAAIGTPYREARQKYVYQPQTQSGKAMLGGIGALTQPMSDLYQLGGKAIGNALDYVPGVTRQGAQEAGAAAADALSLATSIKSLRSPPSTPQRKPAAIPSTAELKQAKDAAYAQAQNAGVVVQPKSFSTFVDDVSNHLSSKHLNEKLHPGTSSALDELKATVKRGTPLSLEELDQLRQIVRDSATGKGDGRMTRMVMDKLDNYINNLSGKDLVSGDATTAVEALNKARALNRRMENSAMFDELLRKAGIQGAAKYTQAGDEHALRQEFKRIALRKDFTKKFNAAEREAIEKVAKGGKLENAMRNLGKFDPLQGGMATAVSSISGTGLGGLSFLIGGPEAAGLGLAIPLGGYVGRKIATNLTRKNAEAARGALVGPGLPPTGLLGTAPSTVRKPPLGAEAVLLPGMLGQRQ